MLIASMMFADCDMMAMIAKNNVYISNLTDPGLDTPNDFDDPLDYFDYVRERSTDDATPNPYVEAPKYNPDGYGITFYHNGSYTVPYNEYPFTLNTRAFYLDGYGTFYIGEVPTFPAPGAVRNIPLNVAESLVMNYINYQDQTYYEELIDNDDMEATIVMGHARFGTGGNGNHPFRFEHNGRTYTFMHNGSMKPEIKTALNDYLGPNWFTNHPSNWNGPRIDSEIFFNYLMSFIIQYGDVNIALQKALTQTDVEGICLIDKIRYPSEVTDKETLERYYTNVFNFVLSDGEDLYVFKNAPETDLKHQLSYRDNDNFYAIKTLDPRGGTIINRLELMKFSKNTAPEVLYDIEFETKDLSGAGWHWESFPFLERDASYNQPENIIPYFNNIYPFNDITWFEMQSQSDALQYQYNSWTQNTYFVQSTKGYKIDIDPDSYHMLYMTGTRLAEDYVINQTFQVNQDYWLGYWLPQTQNIVDAFGSLWPNVETVSAEDWYYDRCSNARGLGTAATVSWSTAGKSMEYGKAYVITFNQSFSNFSWSNSRSITPGYDVILSDNFTYNELPDYEVIDVLGIPQNVTEIGVYQDNTCVGAAAIQDTAAQILVYSQSTQRSSTPFTLKVITGRGTESPVIDYRVYNQISGTYENNGILPRRQKHSIIRLGRIGQPHIFTPENAIQNHHCFPNPFNPSTRISFSLAMQQPVTVDVFNLKGQKVKTLSNGTLNAGEHNLIWNGTDEQGSTVASGLYFYRIKTSEQEISGKMLLMK